MNINLITSPKNRRYQKMAFLSWYTAVCHLLQESAKSWENRLEDFLLTDDKLNEATVICTVILVTFICWWHFYDGQIVDSRLNAQSGRSEWIRMVGSKIKTGLSSVSIQFDPNDRPLSRDDNNDHVCSLRPFTIGPCFKPVWRQFYHRFYDSWSMSHKLWLNTCSKKWATFTAYWIRSKA